MSKGTEYLRQISINMKKMRGIPSLCSSNNFVLKASLEYAKDNNEFVLIEATANQVNQYGGYTGMRPIDFKNHVYKLAEETGLNTDKIILGGDHLGPVVFKDKIESKAMEEAEVLIAQYVKAGFEKIHIDTSMKLASDPFDEPLLDEVIAKRGARLCKVAEQAYQEQFKRPSELVYVVGSEVPIPGGTQARDEKLKVTTPTDFVNTISEFEKAFKEEGLENVFERVIAIVVQPGVEFGDDSVDEYNRENASKLIKKLDDYDGLIFEGHSTDYQTHKALSEMVRDGIGILKVGPELTFSLREALFALNNIEKELNGEAGFIRSLEKVMLMNPSNWEKYYKGSDEEIALKRKFSFSDRWRYYANENIIENAIQELFDSLDSKEIPLTLISQYLPNQYLLIRNNKLVKKSEEMAKSKVKEILEKYYEAINGN